MSSDEEFRDDHTPLAFFITFRCYGTWLHGDPRGSVDRFHNVYGTPRLGPERARVRHEKSLMKGKPVRLNGKRRAATEKAIRETCRIRKWNLWAINVRSNHVQLVVTGDCKSERVLATLKAKATREMRQSGCWPDERSPWSYRGSRRKLFTQKALSAAIDYVLYDQGEPLVDDDE